MTSFTEPVQADAFFYSKKKKKGLQKVEPPYPSLEAPIADTHAHLDLLSNVPLALARCALYKVGFICSIVDPSEDEGKAYALHETWQTEASSMISSLICASLAQADESTQGFLDNINPGPIPSLRIACGCHPHNARHYSAELEALLLSYLGKPVTCALGEVGLDYHYDYSPREQQREVFRRQINLAHISGLPLILHLREAHEDALKIMDEEGFPEAGTLLHCFNQGWDSVAPWLERGCFIALGGAVTFKKSDETREALKHIPESALLTETDAPYMAPEPMRSMACEPAHTIFTAQKIAEVRGCEPGTSRKQLLTCMYNNALALLDRAPSAWQLNKE